MKCHIADIIELRQRGVLYNNISLDDYLKNPVHLAPAAVLAEPAGELDLPVHGALHVLPGQYGVEQRRRRQQGPVHSRPDT